MRAAQHAGSRPSRCRQPLAVPALAIVLAVLVALAGGCAHPEVHAVAGTTRATPAPQTGGAAPPFDDAGYWAVADHLQASLDGLWSERLGRYSAARGGCESMINALMLLTHSVAAQRGYEGRARHDHRARLIARALVTAPVFVTHSPSHTPGGTALHAPGWNSSLSGGAGDAHEVFDSEIVDGLVAAWRARRELGLPASTSRLIAQRIHAVASSRFWRWPA